MRDRIRVACAREFQWGVFREPAAIVTLAAAGIELTRWLPTADVIVAPDVARLQALRRVLPWKRYLVYADDPRHDRWPEQEYPARGPFPAIHVANVFSGDVFVDNYSFCAIHEIGVPPHPSAVDEEHFRRREKTLAAALAASPSMRTAPPPPLGTNLHAARVAIVEAAFRAGFARVLGGGWPSEYGAADTGYAAQTAAGSTVPWSRMKLDWLGRYWFNLCLENTLAPHYVTEKIWHAVIAGCVPVYYGRGSTILADFPPGSFVDAADFDEPAALVEHLREMSATRACEIYNAAVAAYTRMLERRPRSNADVEVARAARLAARLRAIAR